MESFGQKRVITPWGSNAQGGRLVKSATNIPTTLHDIPKYIPSVRLSELRVLIFVYPAS